MCPAATALVRHEPPVTDEKCRRSANESSGRRDAGLDGPNEVLAIQALTHMHHVVREHQKRADPDYLHRRNANLPLLAWWCVGSCVAQRD